MRRALLLLCLCGVSWLAVPAYAGPEHDKTRDALLAALRSKNVRERVRAFDLLKKHADVAALRAGLDGVAEVLEARRRAWARIQRHVTAFERARTKDMEAQDRVAAARRRGASSGRIRQLEGAKARAGGYRRSMGRALEAARAEVRAVRALLGAAARQVGALLGRMRELERRNALFVLRQAYASGDDPEGWLLLVDALVASQTKPAAAELARLASGRAQVARRLQALALDGLGGLDPSRAVGIAVAWLALEDLDAAWHLPAAAIAVLRRARAKAGIAPLIGFLARTDIARLREDAHEALVALTHQKHGPYPGPWKAWWAEAGKTFEVPTKEPESTARGAGSSTAFYGIHTFSDRMAFVLDLSWSMWRDAGSGRRIDTALEQLRGAVGTLDESRRFAVAWFGTRAAYWKPRTVAGSERVKRDLERWIRTVDGRGQTNAYAGLELAFRLARGGEGRPLVDTVFFLTDGAATAGPLSSPRDILAEVRSWCRIERVRVHCIGIGEHQPALLEPLARLGRGRYVRK